MQSEKSSPSVFVVILNYNGKNFLNKCLSSVFQSDYPKLDIVVVDNNSTDGSFEDARRTFPRAHFIKNSQNVGFSKGNNLGIRYSLEKFADYIFLLNNDAFITNQTISVLVEAAEKIPTCGAISPMIMTGDGKDVWFSGGKIDWFSMRASHSSSTTKGSLYQTKYLSGCALLIKKKVFEKIGLFDERFFLYYEDVDFSFRTKRAGFSLFVLPQEKVFHQEQSNNENPKKLYWLVLSALIFFKEHGAIIHKAWYFFFMPIRKIKNFLNLKFSKDAAAVFVKQAYEDFRKISRN